MADIPSNTPYASAPDSVRKSACRFCIGSHPKDGIRRRPNDLGYAYRIVDENCWKNWLSQIAGYPTADLEVVRRTLRVRDQKPAARLAEVTQKSHQPPVPTLPKSPAPVFDATPLPSPSRVVEAKVDAKKPAPAPPPPAKPAVEGDPVKERVLALVAEKTGYPVDMLDLDLDLEADLGIDTVKQAEVMATIREAYGIARDDTIRLRDFPTLARVIQFVHDRLPELHPTQPAPIPAAAAQVKAEPEVTVAPPMPAAISPRT